MLIQQTICVLTNFKWLFYFEALRNQRERMNNTCRKKKFNNSNDIQVNEIVAKSSDHTFFKSQTMRL